MPPLFQYLPEIISAYPNVVGGMIHAPGIVNGPTPPALLDLYTAEQKAVAARIGSTPLSELPTLAAWRAAFRKFGVDPTQYRSASESLLRRLTKKGDIPSINTLVDIGNLVSIRYALPVAMVDLRGIEGGLSVRFANGDEVFTPLEAPEPEHPDKGEVVFVDQRNIAAARRWCWRQSKESAAREDTTDVLVTVEAHHADGRRAIEAALSDLNALLDQFALGARSSAVLDARSAAFIVA
jgi:DNA/RNA-binding domain of Phe-tRNA-synthetase-like protein